MVGGGRSRTESTTSHEESSDEARSASSHRRSRGQELQARQGHRPSRGDPDYSYARPVKKQCPPPLPLSSTESNRCVSWWGHWQTLTPVHSLLKSYLAATQVCGPVSVSFQSFCSLVYTLNFPCFILLSILYHSIKICLLLEHLFSLSLSFFSFLLL